MTKQKTQLPKIVVFRKYTVRTYTVYLLVVDTVATDDDPFDYLEMFLCYLQVLVER